MGILNPWNLAGLIIDAARCFPSSWTPASVLASDAAIAMELGCDGVLMRHRHRPRRATPVAHGQRHEKGRRGQTPGLSPAACRAMAPADPRLADQ